MAVDAIDLAAEKAAREQLQLKLSPNYGNALAAFDGAMLLLASYRLAESLILSDTAVELLLRARIEAEGRFRTSNTPNPLERFSLSQREAIVRSETGVQHPQFHHLLKAFCKWSACGKTHSLKLKHMRRMRNYAQHVGRDSIPPLIERHVVDTVLNVARPFIADAFAEDGLSLSAACATYYREVLVASKLARLEHAKHALLTLVFKIRHNVTHLFDDGRITFGWSDDDDVTAERRERDVKQLRSRGGDVVELECRICRGCGHAAVDLGTCSSETGEQVDPPYVLGFACPECGLKLLRDEPPGILDAHLQVTPEEWAEIMKDTK